LFWENVKTFGGGSGKVEDESIDDIFTFVLERLVNHYFQCKIIFFCFSFFKYVQSLFVLFMISGFDKNLGWHHQFISRSFLFLLFTLDGIILTFYLPYVSWFSNFHSSNNIYVNCKDFLSWFISISARNSLPYELLLSLRKIWRLDSCWFINFSKCKTFQHVITMSIDSFLKIYLVRTEPTHHFLRWPCKYRIIH
jgi:hypothetical protein